MSSAAEQPNLARLLADPARIPEVPAAELPAILAELERVKALLWARLVAGNGGGHETRGKEDRMLDVTAAAERSGMSKAWLYQNHQGLPFAKKVGRKVLFSEAGLTRWLASRPR